MAGDNQGDFLGYVREEGMEGDLGRSNKKGVNIISSVKSGDLMKNKSHEDTPKSSAKNETKSYKAMSIYVGQWDCIKEKMVWESMGKDIGLQGTEGVVTEGVHVG